MLERLTDPVSLIVTGVAGVDQDVTAGLVEEKAAGIHLLGTLTTPKSLAPSVQTRIIDKIGRIHVSEGP